MKGTRARAISSLTTSCFLYDSLWLPYSFGQVKPR
jgi:hypothetical protein